MALKQPLASLAGSWSGTNLLRLAPGEPVQESSTRAEISLAAQGRFLVVAYTWAVDGTPQDGMLTIGVSGEERRAIAAWIDSWHMGDRIMQCEGHEHREGHVSVLGSYAAPPGPDWGWRIQLESDHDAHALRLLMFNLTPQGEEAWAVDARYSREPARYSREPARCSREPAHHSREDAG